MVQFPMRAVVGIHPPAAFPEHKVLFALLEKIFPVSFEVGFPEKCVAVIDLEETSGGHRLAAAPNVPAFLVRPSRNARLIKPATITFSGRPLGQPYLEGSRFELGARLQFGVVDSAVVGEIVLEAEGRVLWVETSSSSGERVTVAGSLPDLPTNTPAVLCLTENRWLQLVPLLDFLVTVTASFDWERRPPGACLMFDDPNLHWKSFGFIDFHALVQHSKEHNYHAAMAMVPLDTWYTNSRAAELFRANKDRLSLLIHGTYHTHAELIRSMHGTERLELLREGMRRVQRLESDTGIQVSRVMAPPHHACSVEACELMLRAGYDAACVSWTALVRHNDGVNWPEDFGLHPVELVGNEFPVVPRFNFAGREDSRVFLAALLRQPIIMIGHHWDLAEGLSPLAKAAQTVNRLGVVEWSNMSAIMRRSWVGRQDGRNYHVRMFSREVDIPVPERVDIVTLESLSIDGGGRVSVEVLDDSGRSVTATESGGKISIEVSAGSVVHLRLPRADMVSSGGSLPQLPRLVAYVRRFACEARDRAMPYIKPLRRGE